jgi:hypothetical protein
LLRTNFALDVLINLDLYSILPSAKPGREQNDSNKRDERAINHLHSMANETNVCTYRIKLSEPAPMTPGIPTESDSRGAAAWLGIKGSK